MRAGTLDRQISIERLSTAIDEAGTPIETWTEIATPRAALVQASTAEYLRGYGETEAMAVIFRIRWLDGITPGHRVTYDERTLNVREVTEIGRRRGLELRCDEVRS